MALTLSVNAASVVAVIAFPVILYRLREKRRRTKADQPTGLSRLIFLGTGCSGGTPIALCMLGLIPGRPTTGCHVCRSAYMNPTHPNNRRNPSVLIQNPKRSSNTLIDCGKTFRDAALAFFPKFGVKGIDHIILTHEHADAVFGLDEIRMVQYISKNSVLRSNPPEAMTIDEFGDARRKEIKDIVGRAISGDANDVEDRKKTQDAAERAVVSNASAKAHPLAAMYDDVIVHSMERTKKAVMTAFPYLVSKGEGAVPRFVSQLAFEPFELNLTKPFYIKDFFGSDEPMEVIPLPVEHGADFMCAGFRFGRKDVVVYISDVSKIPQETIEYLRSIPLIRLFVIDSLRPVNFEKATRPMVHFDLADALESVRNLGRPPVETILVGLGHEFDHHTTNEMLALLPIEVFGKVRCGQDGLVFDLAL